MATQEEINEQFFEQLVALEAACLTAYRQARMLEDDFGVPCGRTRTRLDKAYAAVNEAKSVFDYDVVRGYKKPTVAQREAQYETELS